MTVWYIARGAGLAALTLFTLSLSLGALVSRPDRAAVAASTRATQRRYLVQYLHRTFAGLAVVATAVHVTSILADAYAHVGWLGALVPLQSGYRPGWVALGTLAAWTFVAVSVLGLARGRIATSATGARVWRGLHSLAYVGWALAVLHGLFSGTDTSVGWVQALYVACGVVGLGAIAVRVTRLARAGATVPFPRQPLARLQGAHR